MAEQPPAGDQEKLSTLAQQIAKGVLESTIETGIGKRITAELIDTVGALLGLAFSAMAPIGVGFAKAIATAEDVVAPQMADFAAAAVSDAFGQEVPASTFATKRNSAGRQRASDGLGAGVLNAIMGNANTLEPSDAGAKRYLGFVINMGLEGWYQGWMLEYLSSLVPQLGIGNLEKFADLDDTLSQALGLGRMSRRVMGPLLDATVVTPLRWQVNKTYRPELLSPALAVRQFHRGKLSREQLNEELARQGWSVDRIDALIFDASKGIGLSDISAMISEGLLDQEAAIPRLKALGFDDEQAALWGTIDKFRRRRVVRDNIVPLATSAYARREIDGVDLDNALEYALPNIEERHEARAHADHARAFRRQFLSQSEVKEAVERGILSMIDYRRWLEREGYVPEDAMVLELLLTAQLRGQHEADKARAAAAAERATEKAKRDADAKRRADELAAKKARIAAPLSDVERAVVVGILSIDVYAARLRELNFPADDVAFEVELLQHEREAYLERQERAERAKGPSTPATIALGTLERAVVRGAASVEQYRARLVADGYDAGDIAIMVQLAVDARADRQRAEQARIDAAAQLGARGLSLGQVERAVRQGLLSPADYQAWLVVQGFEAQDAALLRASLDQDIADAAAAAVRRDAINAAAKARGIGLAQLERAVKLGARDRADYQQKLIALEVSVDDQVTLLGILDAELAQLDDARARRDAPTPAPEPPGLTRGDMEKAVRAGVLTIGGYRAFLAGAGYGPDDVDVLVGLLTLELQNTALARQRRDQVDVGNQARQLARADMERAVRKGIRTMVDYEAFVAAAGYAGDDQELLIALLQAELDAKTTAQQRRTKISAELAGAGVQLEVLEAAAIAGELTLDAYVQQLAAAGVKPADIGLLVQLVIEPMGEAATDE